MKKYYLTLMILGVVFSIFAQDKKGCETSEPTYLQRMPGFFISSCKNSEYNDKEFIYEAGGKTIVLKKGGKYYEISYTKDPTESRKFSSAQIVQNYVNAILKIKGKILDENRKTVMTASINRKEVFLEVAFSNSPDAGSYWIKVIEVEQMQQDVVINMEEAIDRGGKAALYGILFDVGKSDIKPESAEALKQIVDYLNAKPAVKVIVVGHTDNTGTYAGNITLSKARAESIKKYLITTGKIPATRLIAEGVGQSCPVSTNATEDGRKLNRRVEIVKQ